MGQLRDFVAAAARARLLAGVVFLLERRMIVRPPNAYPANRTEVDFLRRFYWNGMSNLFPANVRKVDWCFWLLVFLFVRHKILLYCENGLRPKITSKSHPI